MRLESREIDCIKHLAKKYFGENIAIYLFGSRTDDQKKGGDIDLFLSGIEDEKFKIESKIKFLVDLKIAIGDQKIDLVFDNQATKRKESFYQSINSQKIPL